MDVFRFANPEYFYLLAALPLLVGVFVWSAVGRRKRIARFGDPATVATLMPDASPRRYRTKFVLWLVVFSLVVFALARPQYGSKLREVKTEGIELMLAVDVSNSMLAEDFEPNRLERTKYAIDRLLDGLDQDRVGLVVFAGDAYVQLPITSDYMTAKNFARQISPSIVSRQGTAIGAAIELAASSFSSDSEGSRVIVLITDGENHEDDALAAARMAAEKGIQIYTIGIGTPEGAPIKIGKDFIKDENGNMVVSKLDEAVLRQIAVLTGGAYIRSTNQSLGLSEIIQKINDTQRSEFTAQFEEYNELFQWFLAASLVVLLIQIAILTRKNHLLGRFNVFKKE
jgi:Ca-activated chloride channel family protein